MREGMILDKRDQRRPELIWVAGSWVACDPTLPSDDPRRVLAYLECRDARVYLLWVRDRTGTVTFGSLREAVDAIGGLLCGGVSDNVVRAGIGPSDHPRPVGSAAIPDAGKHHRREERAR